jgi:Holliday junction DNA helicase RuvA
MISSLNGKLIHVDPLYCVIECSGIGFKCFITSKTLGFLSNAGDNVKLYTYMSVKEDAIDLYGFSDMAELECFKLITSVSGVGPKIGLALLSTFDSEQIANYIAANDPKSLTAASGVGLKLAQRIILELKDKVAVIPGVDNDVIVNVKNTQNNSVSKDAIAALTALGYSQSEASLAVGRCSPDLQLNDLIKEALKQLMRQV